MSKELGPDSRFEDLFQNRFRFPEVYERIRSAVEETAPLEVKKAMPIDMGIEDALFYTPEQVASTLGVRPATVRRWIRDGEIQATKIGKKFYRVQGSNIREIMR